VPEPIIFPLPLLLLSELSEAAVLMREAVRGDITTIIHPANPGTRAGLHHLPGHLTEAQIPAIIIAIAAEPAVLQEVAAAVEAVLRSGLSRVEVVKIILRRCVYVFIRCH
jgi:hypothetical protein